MKTVKQGCLICKNFVCERDQLEETVEERRNAGGYLLGRTTRIVERMVIMCAVAEEESSTEDVTDTAAGAMMDAGGADCPFFEIYDDEADTREGRIRRVFGKTVDYIDEDGLDDGEEGDDGQ